MAVSNDDSDYTKKGQMSRNTLNPYAACNHINALGLNLDCNQAPKRGWVLIIKNTNFWENEIPYGDEVDRLQNLFQKYHYNVECYTNVSADKLLKIVGDYAAKADSKCFVCFISSHGDYSSIQCMGDTSVKTKDIFEKANTEQLKGHPKCIFIDACRKEDPKGVDKRPEIPHDNFFVGMSSLAYKPSYANQPDGDYYLRRIATIFEESFALPAAADGKVRDIDYLMKKVNRDVQEYAEKQGKTQIPIYESSLKAMLFLQGIGPSK